MTGPVPHRDFLPPPTFRTRLTDLALVVVGCVALGMGCTGLHRSSWRCKVPRPLTQD